MTTAATAPTATATVEALASGRFLVAFLAHGRVTDVFDCDRPLACSTLVMGGFVGREASDLVNRAASLAGSGLLAFGQGFGEKA